MCQWCIIYNLFSHFPYNINSYDTEEVSKWQNSSLVSQFSFRNENLIMEVNRSSVLWWRRQLSYHIVMNDDLWSVPIWVAVRGVNALPYRLGDVCREGGRLEFLVFLYLCPLLQFVEVDDILIVRAWLNECIKLIHLFHIAPDCWEFWGDLKVSKVGTCDANVLQAGHQFTIKAAPNVRHTIQLLLNANCNTKYTIHNIQTDKALHVQQCLLTAVNCS